MQYDNKISLSYTVKNNSKAIKFEVQELLFKDIPSLTKKHHYSNLIFNGGERKGVNFLSANLLTLDVDGGLAIDQAKVMLDGYRSLIVTTKSHQKTEKNGNPIEAQDRFRIFIDLEEPISDPIIYQQVIQGLINTFHADQACKDLARFYYCNPNQEVITIGGDKYWDISQYLKKEVGNSQPPLAPQKKAKGKGGKIKFEDTQIVKTSSYGELNVEKLFETLEDGSSETIHCCIHPENHAHNDATPSCVVSRNGEYLNFKCYVCEDTAYYHKKEKKIPFLFLPQKVVIQEGLTLLEDIMKEAINSLPMQYEKNEKKLVKVVVENILYNCALPICAYANTLHIYYHGKWHAIDNPEAEKYILVKGMVEKTLGFINPIATVIHQVLAELKTIYQSLNGYINRKDVYINMANGVVRISKEGSINLLPHDPSYGFKWQLPYNYNPEANCPQTLQFLQDVVEDENAIKVLQEFFGYIFLPHKFMNHEKCLWLYGSTGANGKSVLLSLVHQLIDETNISHMNLSELADPIKRTMLLGKVLNITNDATTKGIDAGTYKALISGETTTIRQLYKGAAELKAPPKFIIATNELPLMEQGAEAFVRRMILVPFNKQIPEAQRDIHLSSKLTSEVEGFFNFALVGLQRLIENQQFTKSNLIASATSDYLCELDVLSDFLQDHPIEALHGKNVPYLDQSEIFTKIGEWCKQNHRKNPYNTPRQLRDKLISQKDHSFDLYKNNKIYGIKGRWQLTKVEVKVPSDVSDYE
ncbi:DNA primase family protein [Sulfurospirillum oryzae]|uniref:DNA primase family protein n=1 Tax=Sulfurospirillum oryzae TaxID=2976535 RepID=UPI0021E8E3EE|nr:phage/plasmid primase, P4 family [Sulfurospirillum oryzae]